MQHPEIISTLDLLNHYLDKRGQSRTFIICGGASLILQNIVARATQDIDVVSPEIDQVLRAASEEVAQSLGLNPDWLNSAPEGLSRDMSLGWQSRIIQDYNNTCLTVFSISREGMIFAKFYAYCDRQKDIFDLVDLAPTPDELDRAVKITAKLDGHPGWPEYVEKQRLKLRKRLGHE